MRGSRFARACVPSGLARRAVGAAAVVVGGLVLVSAPVASAQTTTQTLAFDYTGAEQTFVVPNGVTSLHVEAIGAPGGDRADAGGLGDDVSSDLSVTPGEPLYVEVGGPG